MGGKGELIGSLEPTEDLCRQAEDRAQFRGRGLGFSAITVVQTIFLEKKQGREVEA